MQEIVPFLPGTICLGADPIGPKAVVARWRMGNGALLTIITNLHDEPVMSATPAGRLLFASGDTAPMTVAYLERAA
jgi:maltooligosyltrehalose trehalohydrolase